MSQHHSSSSSKKRHSDAKSHADGDDRKHKKAKQAEEGQAVFTWNQSSGSSTDNSQRVEGVLGELTRRSKQCIFQPPVTDQSSLCAYTVDSPSFTPPKSMTLYHKKHHTTSSSSSSSSSATTSDSLVIGHRPSHSPNIIVESTNWDLTDIDTDAEKARAKGFPGSYLIGIYDPATRKVSLHPAPLLSISRSIVPQGPDGSDASSARIQANYNSARRDLGELFGNRKQKLAMRNADRMKVDTTGMAEDILQGITDSVQDSKVESQPSSQHDGGAGAADPSQPSAAELATRPIPTPHLDATSPEFVYPLSELFPPQVSTNVNPTPLIHATDIDHIKKILPGPVYQSKWLQARIWSRVLANRRAADEEAPSGILKSSSSSPQKTQVKQLLYIAILWSIRSLAQQTRGRILGDRNALKEKLKLQRRNGEGADPSAEALLDQILALYCEKERQNNRLHLTPFLETKLLATICALCLHIDGFQSDPEMIASGMGLQPVKIKEVLKSLGCSTRYRQSIDTSANQDADKKAKKEKVMVLKCPVVLPSGRSGQPPKR